MLLNAHQTEDMDCVNAAIADMKKNGIYEEKLWN